MKLLDDLSQQILTLLREEATTIVSGYTLSSPRSVGDAVQSYIAEEGLQKALQTMSDMVDIQNCFSRRAMEDVAFTDKKGNYYAIDVKTHNKDTLFNMPNLISVRRLANFYQNSPTNYFCILIVTYHIEGGQLKFEECVFKPIEYFSWDCLTLGALGWGQIQIANANKLQFSNGTKSIRKEWMLALCDRLDEFYETEIGKIVERRSWFSKVREYWLNTKQ